jgi:hypothetical protein
MPNAIDLEATRPDGVRVIFEAKTINGENELSQTRAGFAQLHEYRHEYRDPADELCLAVDRPLSERRRALLDALDVAVIVVTDANLTAGNDRGAQLVGKLPPATSSPAAGQTGT